MPGDYTRFTFDPFEDHFGVLMQQGRVMLDSDFNEWVETLERQFRVRMLDTVGHCVVPRETPNGFQIQVVGNTITIGRGRAYVHGLLAENHGADAQGRPVTALDADALEYDALLEERRGLHAIAFEHQPYLPNAAALLAEFDQGTTLLLYLDVWQREVTHVQEPDLVEKALGVDTATRVQVVWQVKALAVPRTTTCATPDDAIPEWLELTAPPAGRLTTNAVGVPASDDPCIIAPNGGYRGTENRLYRVEVHDGGTDATATFKWSRDNASIKTSVIAINGGLDVLTVARTGRDAVRRFAPGHWIEVIDDNHELVQTPGEMRQVLSVDEVNRTITLNAPLSAGAFNQADPGASHTRIRRWDQSGQVLDASNTVIDDVDSNGGVIRIAAGGKTMVLEDGVEVTFSETPAGGLYRTGDYWVFAARTVDASVEPLVEAPPKGIIHHYCRLAIVEFPITVTDDCRIFWPLEFGEAGCDCTECVSAESHNSGQFTIQMAVDRVRATGGKVCLGPGFFFLGESPVTISGAQSIQIVGHGWRTGLFYLGTGAAIAITGSTGIDLSEFSVFALAASELPNLALLVQGSALVRVERCLLAQFGGGDRGGPAIGLSGALIELALNDNVLYATVGITSFASGMGNNPTFASPTLLAAARTYTLTFGLRIERNFIVATRRGISFENLTLHLGDTQITKNRLFGSREVSVLSNGFVFAPALGSSRIDISGNAVTAQGVGIACGTDNTRIVENDIGVFPVAGVPPQNAEHRGVLLTSGVAATALTHVQVLSNRISGFTGNAIEIETAVASAMIKQNIIEEVGGGIVMSDEAEAEVITIENNQLFNVGTTRGSTLPIRAIRAFRSRQLAIAGNSIDAFALLAVEASSRVAIEAVSSNVVRIAGNDLHRIGPPGGFAQLGAGIRILGPFDRLDVLDNSLRRNVQAVASDSSQWIGILIGGAIIGPQTSVGAFVDASAIGRAVFFPLADNTVDSDLLVVGLDFLAIVARAPDRAAVRGNLVESYGSAAAVRVAVQGPVLFSDNRCQASMNQSTSAAVDIDSTSVIASSNQIERSPLQDASVALDLTATAQRFTVLGNICSGGIIRINGAPLSDPWAPLNMVGA